MDSKKIKILYLISVSVFLTYLIILLKHYPDITEVVTTHVNIRGESDRHGSKINLVFASMANLGVLLLMGYLIKNPHLPNYPVEITPENRNSSYRKMQLFLSAIAIVTSCSFAYMIFKAVGYLDYYLFLIGIVVIIPLVTILFFEKRVKN